MSETPPPNADDRPIKTISRTTEVQIGGEDDNLPSQCQLALHTGAFAPPARPKGTFKSPIDVLPVEIIAMFIAYCSLLTVTRLRELSTVCSAWWRLITSTPSLWKYVFGDETTKEVALKLRKSGCTGLQLKFRHPYMTTIQAYPTTNSAVLDLTIPHAYLIQLLDVDVEVHDTVQALLNLPMPCLTDIRLQGSRNRHASHTPVFRLAEAKALRRIETHNVELEWGDGGQSFTKLVISEAGQAPRMLSQSYWNAIKALSGGLEELCLEGVEPSASAGSRHASFLPNLKRISLRRIHVKAAVGILQSLRTDTLLEFEFQLWYDIGPEREALKALATSPTGNQLLRATFAFAQVSQPIRFRVDQHGDSKSLFIEDATRSFRLRVRGLSGATDIFHSIFHQLPFTEQHPVDLTLHVKGPSAHVPLKYFFDSFAATRSLRVDAGYITDATFVINALGRQLGPQPLPLLKTTRIGLDTIEHDAEERRAYENSIAAMMRLRHPCPEVVLWAEKRRRPPPPPVRMKIWHTLGPDLGPIARAI